MTKKDYEAAACIAQKVPEWEDARLYVINAFVALFRADSARFDEDRFRRACIPGANVRARP